MITNAPLEKISVAEAEVLYGSRWQIELIFKLWKQDMKLEVSRSQNPWRILCERYIKLLVALIQHWIVLTSPIWQAPEKSLVKAYKIISDHARCLAHAFDCEMRLATQLKQLTAILSSVARQARRKKSPNTWQKLLFVTTGWA